MALLKYDNNNYIGTGDFISEPTSCYKIVLSVTLSALRKEYLKSLSLKIVFCSPLYGFHRSYARLYMPTLPTQGAHILMTLKGNCWENTVSPILERSLFVQITSYPAIHG